ncbi:hypothetical protein M7I_3718 [Glarea lozoyensis 74030]|uniref:5-oxoprolinase n=1 Tax=Glarea lozoyensis (strain ATCC 74030 / MF5533) TaxID=1104152 RepID=H0EM88_GLAL7|nr:hypothetical protein M7I_3718 [Glarea lozoyensis 74030]
MVVTKGFKDCLEIGNQSRPRIFDLGIKKPEVLYDCVLEIDERVTLEDYAEDPERNITAVEPGDSKNGLSADLVKGLSSEAVRILRRPNKEIIEEQLQQVYDKGIRSIAVCLMHGYTFPDHEALVGKVAKRIGFSHISLSHELMPMIKLVPRATSACADAYLTPAIKKYIAGFQKGFEGGLGSESVKEESGSKGARCEFMQSDGGLVDVEKFSGLKAILSGPAGGVVGYALTSFDAKSEKPPGVIGFDMGGTSTDVSRFGGRYEHVFETTTAGVTIQSPQLDINTVAAGGGSQLFFKNGLFVVGPESAGAHPGPACYRKGGPATVTDANLVLNRLLPDFFPRIFGKNEDEGLDVDASNKVLQDLTEQVNKETGKSMSVDEVAYGFLTVANETMTRPIRSLTEAKGHDTSKHRLATFGGAGGQHAVAIAESLGIKQILVHRYSSVLSAYGMALADVVDERQEPESKVWDIVEGKNESLRIKIEELKEKSKQALHDQGFGDKAIVYEEYLNMRYRGTESALMIVKPEGKDFAFGDAFVEQHQQEFGFTFPDRDIIVDDVRVRGIGKSFQGLDKSVDVQLKEIKPKDIESGKKEYKRTRVYFGGKREETPIYKLEDLEVGDRAKGPAILVCPMCTTSNAEVFERRYPVILREFSLRAGSGGKGQHRGGNGVVRDIEFRMPETQVSILSERRVYRPYGLAGGEDAECGLNIWRSDKMLNGDGGEIDDVVFEERRINLGGKNTALMKSGERIIICTPGGGGWGRVGDEKELRAKDKDPKHAWKGGSHANREDMALQA